MIDDTTKMESSILKRMLEKKYEIDSILASGLKADHFTNEFNKFVFDEIKEGDQTLTTIVPPLATKFGETSSNIFVANLLNSPLYDTETIDVYISILKSNKRNRDAKKRLSSQMEEISTANNDTILKAIEKLGKTVNDYVNSSPSIDVIDHAVQAGELYRFIEERFNNPREISGLQSGMYGLDRATDGFPAGNITIVGGRPGMGKTTVLLNMTKRMLESGKRIYSASLELPYQQWGASCVSMLTGIPRATITRGGTDKELEYIKASIETMKGYDLVLQDGISDIDELVIDIKKAHASKPLDVVFVDHFQEVTANNHKFFGGVDRANYIAITLKKLAKELDIPLILAAQLNRNLEARADKRPAPSDLKDTGTLEQLGALIIFLYRDFVYNEESDPKELEFVIAKNRFYTTGVYKTTCDLAKCRVG